MSQITYGDCRRVDLGVHQAIVTDPPFEENNGPDTETWARLPKRSPPAPAPRPKPAPTLSPADALRHGRPVKAPRRAGRALFGDTDLDDHSSNTPAENRARVAKAQAGKE